MFSPYIVNLPGYGTFLITGYGWMTPTLMGTGIWCAKTEQNHIQIAIGRNVRIALTYQLFDGIRHMLRHRNGHGYIFYDRHSLLLVHFIVWLERIAFLIFPFYSGAHTVALPITRIQWGGRVSGICIVWIEGQFLVSVDSVCYQQQCVQINYELLCQLQLITHDKRRVQRRKCNAMYREREKNQTKDENNCE